MKKHLSRVLLCALLALLLTGCGSSKKQLKIENPDRTVTKILCVSSNGFARAPHFELDSDTAFTMSFNGIDWYRAEAVSDADAAVISEGELLAQSTNLRVYPSDGRTDFAYLYLLDLEGTDACWLRFDTDTPPDRPDTGSDFRTGLTVSVDGAVTLPDVSGLLPPEQGTDFRP